MISQSHLTRRTFKSGGFIVTILCITCVSTLLSPFVALSLKQTPGGTLLCRKYPLYYSAYELFPKMPRSLLRIKHRLDRHYCSLCPTRDQCKSPCKIKSFPILTSEVLCPCLALRRNMRLLLRTPQIS